MFTRYGRKLLLATLLTTVLLSGAATVLLSATAALNGDVVKTQATADEQFSAGLISARAPSIQESPVIGAEWSATVSSVRYSSHTKPARRHAAPGAANAAYHSAHENYAVIEQPPVPLILGIGF